MGLQLILTDAELPASPSYIEFLYATIKKEPYYVGEWYKQDGEGMMSDGARFADISARPTRSPATRRARNISCVHTGSLRSF